MAFWCPVRGIILKIILLCGVSKINRNPLPLGRGGCQGNGSCHYGDCEDYCLDVMYNYFDKRPLKFLFMLLFSTSVNIHYVMTNGIGHVVGQIGYLWFDNFTYHPYVRGVFFKKTNHLYVRKISKTILFYKLVSHRIKMVTGKPT